MGLATRLVTVVAVVAISAPVAAQDDDSAGRAVTFVPDAQFCNLIADDQAACEEALATLATAGMVPESFAVLLRSLPQPTGLPEPVRQPEPADAADAPAPRVRLTFSGDWNYKVDGDFYGICLWKRSRDGTLRPESVDIYSGDVEGEPDIFTDGAWNFFMSSEANFKFARLTLYDDLAGFDWDGQANGTVTGVGYTMTIDAPMRSIGNNRVRVKGSVTCPESWLLE